MNNIKGFLHGIYPRSDKLIHVSRDVIRKRKKKVDYEVQFQNDCKSLLNLQRESDLDFIEDGKLGWQDIFRPIVEATEGLETGALTRWFDNNCFFRRPVLTGKLHLDEIKLERYFPQITPKRKWKVTLPSPFVFSRLTQNNTAWSFEKILHEITSVISKIVVYLNKRGVTFIQFNEPFLPYHGALLSDLSMFNRSLTQLSKVKGNLIFALHFYFGDASPIVKRIKSNDFIDIVGVDFYKTALSSIGKDFPFGLAAGILDGRNSLLEDEDMMKRFVEKAVNTFKLKNLYLTNNSDLDLLPQSIARKKVALVAKVRKGFKD